MPKLNYPKITKGDAITALLKLYRKEPDFMTELDKIRQPYMAILSKFAKDSKAFFKNGSISPAEYYQAAIDYSKGKSKKDPFPAETFHYLSQLQPYFDCLSELAHKWKLRAPWAVIVLSLFDLTDLLKAQGLPDEIDIPLENFESIYPWAPPLPPLEIKVPAWAIIRFGRKKILSEIANKLQRYENDLKTTSLQEYPSSVEKHVRWWFEHYVKGKTYVEIDEQFQEAYAETIKRKVWNISKLIGIKMR